MKANQSSKLYEASDFHEFKKSQTAMWNILIEGVFAIIIVYAAMNIGTFINGTIGDSLYRTYPAAASRSAIQNSSVWGLRNLSSGFTTNVGMVNITAQISLIIIPLMLVLYVKKLAS